MAASFGHPNPSIRRCHSHDQSTMRDPLAYQPSPLAGVHSMKVLAIAEKWTPYRRPATVYRRPPPSSR
jgi:hypothetical protein